MELAGYNIKPVSIYLPDDALWRKRDAEGFAYFEEQGIEDIHKVAGIHAQKWGIEGRHIFLLDGRPEEQFYIGTNKVGCFLTQYCVYTAMNALPDSHFLFLETDCRFEEGWKEKLEQALQDCPSDFDFLFAASCCCADKEPIHVKGQVYHFPWRGQEKKYHFPQCAHMMIIAKKCVPHLIATQRDVASPPDISLIAHAFPQLNIYAILPSLANQGKTFLPP